MMKIQQSLQPEKRQIRSSIAKALDALSSCRESWPAVFPACLVLNCLSETESRKYRKHVAEFILSQKSESWSWNYRPRTRKGFPDDLDDTSCALIALQRAGIIRIDAGILAPYAKNLISAERHEGGPYATWIGNSLGPNHADVDVAVNANIAYFLALQGIFLDALDRFLLESLRKGDFRSLYYKSTEVFAYYLSRYLALHPERLSPEQVELGKYLAKLMRPILNDSKSSAQSISLAICSLIRIGAATAGLAPSIHRLLSLQDAKGYWPKDQLYIEKITDGHEEYFQCKRTATAFCIEALSLFSQTGAPIDVNPEKAALDQIISNFNAVLARSGPIFAKSGAAQLSRLRSTGMDRFIALLPYHFNQSLLGQSRLDSADIIELGSANLFGWIGYTIQDDIADEGASISLLPFSNFCVRQSLDSLCSTAADDRSIAYIRATFDDIDSANFREISKAQDGAPVETLADKSFGHALGPLIICARLGHGPESPIFRAIEGFFRHYIIGRQMSDDAHDWERDLARGKLNSASAAFIDLPQSDELENMDGLRRTFWDKAIDKIARKIHYHLSMARSHAAVCQSFMDSTYLDSLLAPIERSATRAIDERNRAVDFIEKFTE